MDETNPYINAVYRRPEWQFQAEGAESATTAGFRFDINNQDYYFVPRSVFEKGVVSNKTNYFFPSVLSADFEQQIAPYAQQYTPQQVYDTLYNYSTAVSPNENKWLQDVKAAGYKEDEPGFLIPARVVQNLIPEAKAFDLGSKFGTKYGDVQFSGIQGIGTKDGQKVFVTDVSGSSGPNAQAFIAPSGDLNYSTYKEPASWAKAANIVGYGLIGLGTAGMAGFGPLAGGGATAGATTGATAGATTGATAGTAASGAGIVGTPGVSTIFPVAAPVAPTVTAIAPTTLAAGGLAAGAATNASLYPAVQVAPSFTPAPGSLQAALPGLGVETAASAAPFTAIPGSFQAALPVLGIASAPSLAGNLAAASSGPSITDVLRVANQAQGLLGAGQNPVIPQAPQQQGLPGRPAGTVDYSGILALLQRQATTPGVSSLLAPAQLRQMYQPLLTPSTLSLLG